MPNVSPRKLVEHMVARFERGTFARIADALRTEPVPENRAEFVREAVERELERRGSEKAA